MESLWMIAQCTIQLRKNWIFHISATKQEYGIMEAGVKLWLQSTCYLHRLCGCNNSSVRLQMGHHVSPMAHQELEEPTKTAQMEKSPYQQKLTEKKKSPHEKTQFYSLHLLKLGFLWNTHYSINYSCCLYGLLSIWAFFWVGLFPCRFITIWPFPQ